MSIEILQLKIHQHLTKPSIFEGSSVLFVLMTTLCLDDLSGLHGGLIRGDGGSNRGRGSVRENTVDGRSKRDVANGGALPLSSDVPDKSELLEDVC